jgi:hypothetical protein
VESHHKTEDSEDNISFPLDVMEGRCDEVSKSKVEDPVC